MASETLGSERPHELIDILKGKLWLLWDSMMEINKDASEQPGREVTGCGQGRKEMVRDIIGRRTSRLADVLGLGRRWKEGSRVIALAISGLGGLPGKQLKQFILYILSFQFLVAVSRKIRVFKSEAWGRDQCWAYELSLTQSTPPHADHAPPFLFSLPLKILVQIPSSGKPTHISP